MMPLSGSASRPDPSELNIKRALDHLKLEP